MKHRFPSLLFVAMGGLVPAVLGHLLHWSAWMWGFMSMVALSGCLLMVMTASGDDRVPAGRHDPGGPEPPAAPAEPPYRETRVIDAALPSATEGYDFLFSATVWWQPLPDHATDRSDGAFPALAASSIVSRAVRILHQEEPERASFARYVLEGELAVALPDRSGRVTALAADVTLTLAHADRERLRKLQDLRKDEEIWEYERRRERSMRHYLGDDVLKSAGSAVVWWLARHEDEIEKAVAMIGPLAQIAAAANDEEVPELFRHLLVPPVGVGSETTSGNPMWSGGDGYGGGTSDFEDEVGVSDRLGLLLATLGLKSEMDEYTVFVHRVVRSLEATGLEEAAEEIRQAFLTPAQGEEGVEHPEAEAWTDRGTTGPWAPGTRSADDPASTDAAAEPEVETDTNAPGTGDSSPRPQERGWWEARDDITQSRNLWDDPHDTHRPATPQERSEDDQDDN
ncbi:hypothetical protein B9W62_13695 [Streptomyces sp. CS113]|uniref:hypothetical protein n=1 Tax=Streptomyces sp. CS113 TaxID=1982761 RepID=UPI000B410D26|nr:hypothetical protein [Streptomyces sp. CS113]OWA08848.1 hypothetical protein B9W62_13695 [Streptomyces sp. CS113]